MKNFKIATGTALAAVVAVPLWVQRHVEVDSLHQQAAIQEQLILIARLSAENEGLRKSATPVKEARPLTEDEHLELLKLRNELGTLRQTTNEAARLQAEMQRIRDILKKNENGWPKPPALVLYADELPVRSNRVAQFRQWLQLHPDMDIPELKLITESDWLRSANYDRVTDDEYRRDANEMDRSAEATFAASALSAVKKYTQANDGRFPPDLSQLSSYFDPPIDDAVIQRYQVAPASSLALPSNWSGGDWIITQKGAIASQEEERIVVGSTRRTFIPTKSTPQATGN